MRFLLDLPMMLAKTGQLIMDVLTSSIEVGNSTVSVVGLLTSSLLVGVVVWVIVKNIIR